MTLVSDILRDAAGALLTSTKLTFRRVAPLQGVDGDLVAPVFGTALAGSSTVTTHASTAAFSITLEPGVYAVSYQGPGGIETVTARVPAEDTATLAGCIEQATTIDSSLAAAAAASAAQAALYDGPWFDDFADLLSDTALTYTSGTASSVAVGDWVRIRATGAAYQVMASSATTHDYATTGGVKVMDPSRRVSIIVTSDHQPLNPTQVAAFRGVLNEFQTFTQTSPVRVIEAHVLGDVVHEGSKPGTGAPADYGYPEYLTDWAIRDLPDLIAMPGNHDRDGVYNLESGGTRHEFGWTYRSWQEHMGPTYFSRVRGNALWLFLGDMSGSGHGEQHEAALAWFENQLEESDGYNVFVYMHQPLYGAYGASVAAYNSSGFPASRLDIGSAYQYWSERLATAIEARDNVAAVFFGHVAGSNITNMTSVVEQFGTTHVNVAMNLEASTRLENGGADVTPYPYCVLTLVQGESELAFYRRDAKTGAELPGYSRTFATKYPISLQGDVFDGRRMAQRTHAVIDRSLTIQEDISSERVETAPGNFEARPGIRWMNKLVLTDMAFDNSVIPGQGPGIRFDIPGAVNVQSVDGAWLNSDPGSHPGGGIAAVRERDTDGDFFGALELYAANPDLGTGEGALVRVARARGGRRTLEMDRGIGAVALTSADNLNTIGDDIGVPFVQYYVWDTDVPLFAPGCDPVTGLGGVQYCTMMHTHRETASRSQKVWRSASGGNEEYYRGYTLSAWQPFYCADQTASNGSITVTDAAYSVIPTDRYIRANRAGTVTLTLPSAASEPVGRRLEITTQQAQAVISASSNVIPSDSGTAGTAILPAVAGASALLVSNGTAWRMESLVVPLTANPRETPGRPVCILSAAGTAVTGTTDQTTLWSGTVAADILGPNGWLEIHVLTAQTNNANNKTLRGFYGAGSILESAGGFTSSSGTWRIFWVQNNAATGAQVILAPDALFSPSETGSGTGTDITVDSTASQTLSFTGQLANAADSLSVRWVRVMACYLP